MSYFIYKLGKIPTPNRVSLAFYIISTLCITDLFGFVCRLCITCIFNFNIKGNKTLFPRIHITLHPAICFHVYLAKTNTTKLINMKYNYVTRLCSNMHIFATLSKCWDVTSSLFNITFHVFRARIHVWFYGRNQCQNEFRCSDVTQTP